MAKINFTPQEHGFHFSNAFSNKIIDTKFGKLETKGRCGGMAFASLDYYLSNIPIPLYQSKDLSNGVPQDGSFLADYIYERQIDSLLTPTAYKFIDWTLASDTSKLFRRGVIQWTKRKEFSKVRKEIDKRNPVVLGLIKAKSLRDIGKNHQVVAYGYDYHPVDNRMTLYIYDSNSPNEEVLLTSDQSTPYFKATNKNTWRGFFVQKYKYKRPRQM